MIDIYLHWNHLVHQVPSLQGHQRYQLSQVVLRVLVVQLLLSHPIRTMMMMALFTHG